MSRKRSSLRGLVAKEGAIRICFVGPMVGRNRGYVTTAGERLADRLQSRGHEVVAVSDSRNRYARFAEIVATLVWQGRRCDVIALMVFGGPSFVVEDAASWIGILWGVPIVMVLRGGAMPEFMERFPRWSRRVLGRASRIVVPSPFLARAVQPYGFAPDVVPNPIPLEKYPFRQRNVVRPKLLWMRAFHPVYHPEMAVRVLAAVRKRYPEATLVMAGQEKGLGTTVRRLAAELGVEAAIRFPGFLDMAGKAREGLAADIFLNTNRIDNQPVSVIEACAMGLPVVATSVGGIPDLLTDGETGLLVPNEDHDAMAGAVLRLIADPTLASRLSAQGRAVAEASAEQVVVPRFEAILEETATARARRGR